MCRVCISAGIGTRWRGCRRLSGRQGRCQDVAYVLGRRMVGRVEAEENGMKSIFAEGCVGVEVTN